MSRPSQNLDQKLIRSALKLLPKTGFTDLNVRDVAKHAKVNLGMFHYHFKNKKEFTRVVLSTFYEEFFATFTVSTKTEGTAEERLRQAMLTIALFIRDNREILFALLKDGISGNKEVMDFVRKNVHRHVSIVLALYKEAQEAGSIQATPFYYAFPMVMGGVALPVFLLEIAKRNQTNTVLGLTLSFLDGVFLSDASVQKRVDLALKTLKN